MAAKKKAGGRRSGAGTVREEALRRERNMERARLQEELRKRLKRCAEASTPDCSNETIAAKYGECKFIDFDAATRTVQGKSWFDAFPVGNTEYSHATVCGPWSDAAHYIRYGGYLEWLDDHDPATCSLPEDLVDYRGLLSRVHVLFLRLVRGERDAAVAAVVGEDLAQLRRDVEPDGEDLQRPGAYVGYRWDIAKYFEWLAGEVVPAPKLQAEQSTPRTTLPDPDPEAVQAALQDLQQRRGEERLEVDEVIRVYDVSGVDGTRFKRSTKFVASAGKPPKDYQLPHRARIRDESGKFVAGEGWTVEEVRGAVTGWASRLGLMLPDGPF